MAMSNYYPDLINSRPKIDLSICAIQPTMIGLTVSGLFKEIKTGHKVSPSRSFFRTLVIVPAGPGFCIVNEALHITNATDEQARNMFKTPESAHTTPVASSNVSQSLITTVDDTTKQQMVTAMSERSGMNLEWSSKCLEETQWDFPRSLAAFEEAQKKGVIPPEAFVK